MIFDAEIIGPWVGKRLGWPWVPGMGSAIGRLNVAGELCAGVIYERFNGPCVTMHVAGDGNWLTREMLWMCFDYPFRQLGVIRITAPVASENNQCRSFIEHLGFRLEAILQDAHPHGDLCFYKMTAQDCRWLRMNHVTTTTA